MFGSGGFPEVVSGVNQSVNAGQCWARLWSKVAYIFHQLTDNFLRGSSSKPQ